MSRGCQSMPDTRAVARRACAIPLRRRGSISLSRRGPRQQSRPGAAAARARSARAESSVAAAPPAALRDQTQSSTGPAPRLDGGEAQQALLGGSLWLIVPLFFALGVGLAFTVCMLPMIPILSGIILGQGKNMTRTRGLILSGSYVLGMALTFTIAGVLVGLSGRNIAPVLQNPWVLGAFAGIFVLLALSMFGFYEIQMPSFVQSKATVASNRLSGGRVFSVFVMGALSAVIIGPCAAPPVFAALAFVSSTGDAVLGGTALFAMALGIGTPLIVVGASAGTLLPKAGPWMQTINRVFGVLMLGLAIWIISPGHSLHVPHAAVVGSADRVSDLFACCRPVAAERIRFPETVEGGRRDRVATGCRASDRSAVRRTRHPSASRRAARGWRHERRSYCAPSFRTGPIRRASSNSALPKPVGAQ